MGRCTGFGSALTSSFADGTENPKLPAPNTTALGFGSPKPVLRLSQGNFTTEPATPVGEHGSHSACRIVPPVQTRNAAEISHFALPDDKFRIG